MSETKASYRTRRSSMLKDGTISEAAFSEQVRQYARLHGWLAYHTWQATNSASGFPDWTFCRPADYPAKLLRHTSETGSFYTTPAPRLIVAELKSLRGKVSLEQEAWLQAIRAAGVQAFVWRPTPECWKEIEEVLGNG